MMTLDEFAQEVRYIHREAGLGPVTFSYKFGALTGCYSASWDGPNGKRYHLDYMPNMPDDWMEGMDIWDLSCTQQNRFFPYLTQFQWGVSATNSEEIILRLKERLGSVPV